MEYIGNVKVIESVDVSKKYNNNKILSHVSMSFDNGHIHLFRGNNGAGKSTYLKILCGLLIPDEGSVLYKGENIEKRRNQYLKHIGVIMADDRSLYHKLTAYENLFYIGRIMGVEKNELKERIAYLLKCFGLNDNQQYVEDFSTGMKKKVMICRAFLHEPEIIYADEVFNGLDADTCRIVDRMFHEYVEKGHTVFLVSHMDNMDMKHVREYEIKEEMIRYVEPSTQILNH
jgi:ABC-2 type transport system ATP-binding protein